MPRTNRLRKISYVPALLSALMLLGCQQPSSPSDEELLRGMWKLSKFEVLHDAGWITFPWNAGGTGYLIYDGRGHGSLHITPAGYSELRWPENDSLEKWTIHELREAFIDLRKNYNYMASYQLDTANKIITHTRLSHSRPEDWGVSVQRRYELHGSDSLWLFPLEGDHPRRLLWIREN